MNIAKNMEAIFIVAIALVSVTSFATAAVPAAHPAKAEVASATQAKMPVVVISAKRAQ